ncbi:MAG: hypothetical protein ACE5LH_07440 [Fidelibacterota bacterium]
MTKGNRSIRALFFAAAAVLFSAGCEKEEGVIGPGEGGLRPTDALVTMDRDLILSSGRDSSLWQIKLVQRVAGETRDFSSVYTVNMMTDRHGYFLKGGRKVKKITLETDANGEAGIYFYGSREPGISTTLIWGEGFGTDSAIVTVVAGLPHYILLKFRDPETGTPMDTDTLRSGRPRFSRPDSTEIEVTILDRDQEPLEGVTVDLSNGEPPIGSGAFGYFASLGSPSEGPSYGRTVTDASGMATDLYYSDVAPAIGVQDLAIVVTVDSARFGSISLSKIITIIPP